MEAKLDNEATRLQLAQLAQLARSTLGNFNCR
jgi:hypothetical protein